MADLNYYDTFIRVAPDCPAAAGTVPLAKGESKPAHLIQYELLSGKPYTYTQADILFEVYVRHKGIPTQVLEDRAAELREAFFSKSHACLRASMLPKKYGWGVHFDSKGRIALYGMETEEYRRCTAVADGSTKLLNAMRNKKVK